ncbi:hypothetical protein [Rheinheimera sp. NSM]|uniref:hypothetical protein n=1 Tax=Rheinheimera sp. NSM TaxID=3457884 RepID=UPI004037338B
MKTTLFSLAVLFQVGAVQAADVAVAPFYIEALRISDGTGTLYIKPVTAIERKNSTCSFTDFYAIAPEDALFNQMYAMLLSAGSAGKKVRIWLSDTPDDCKTSRQRVRLVEIAF